MRWAILLLSVAAFGQELKRPTVDIDPGNVSSYGCVGTSSIPSPAMPYGYDAAGQSSSSNLLVAGGVNATKSITSRAGSRLFKGWQTTTNTYSTLTLNVSSSSQGSIFPDGFTSACIAYSINAGANWTSIRCDPTGLGWTQTTDSVVLSASQQLSKVQVGICVQGSNQNSFAGKGQDNIQLFDVWTVGGTSGQGGGAGSSAGQPHRNIVIVN